MKNRFLLIVAISAILGSCQKEIVLNDPNNPTGGTGGTPNVTGITGGSEGSLLLRAVRKLNGDSVVAAFTYNSANQFMSYTVIGKEKYDTIDVVYNIQKYYTRDAAGRIVSGVSPSTFDTSFFGPLDSTRIKVYYPSTTSKEFTAVVTMSDAIFAYTTDSTVYTYSGGRIVSNLTYTSNSLLPGVPTVAAKTEYDYATTGNIKEIRQYQASSATLFTLVSKSTYTFDNKPSPYFLKNEGVFIDGTYYGPNNPLTGTIIRYADPQAGIPAQTGTINGSYNYNSSGYPKNGLQTANPPYRSYTLTYYYK